jgi:hypothetical protein
LAPMGPRTSSLTPPSTALGVVSPSSFAWRIFTLWVARIGVSGAVGGRGGSRVLAARGGRGSGQGAGMVDVAAWRSAGNAVG